MQSVVNASSLQTQQKYLP
jgi:hypothetical protein